MNNSESFLGGGQVYKFPKLSASSNKYNRVEGFAIVTNKL
jgi:hypothetical protein